MDRRRFAALIAGGVVTAASPRLMARPFRPGEVIDGGVLPAREASWYTKLGEDRVQCDLCPQECTVADAERGTCGVRENRGGTYVTLVHSLACSVHADPIEKKPFFHVMPGELALSYATAGCNVECKFCQNWEISQFRPEQVRSVYLPPEALVEAARRSGARLTAATYSEPVVFWEYVRDAARAARKAGLAPTVVTNGYIQHKPLEEVLPLLRAVKVSRGVLPRSAAGHPRAGSRGARDHPRRRCLARNRGAPHPDPQRLRTRDPRPLEVGQDEPGSRRSAALHAVPPDLPAHRSAADAGRDARTRVEDRSRRGTALRLSRECSDPSGRAYVVPGVR
jgi:hypothetical protein